MSSSPFAAAANAELIFEIPTGQLEEDEYGNPTPQTMQYKVIALLRAGKSDVKLQEGADETWEIREGYLVEPLELPESIRPPMEAQASIKATRTTTEQGVFQLLPISQNPFVLAAGVKEITPIKGLFRRSQ